MRWEREGGKTETPHNPRTKDCGPQLPSPPSAPWPGGPSVRGLFKHRHVEALTRGPQDVTVLGDSTLKDVTKVK